MNVYNQNQPFSGSLVDLHKGPAVIYFLFFLVVLGIKRSLVQSQL